MSKRSQRLKSAVSFAAGTLVAIALAASVSSSTEAQAADNMRVLVDEARIVQLSAQPSTIIVGNPSIADATVHDGTLLVLLGKNYGTTNIIVLDHDAEEILSLDVNVVTSGNHEVSLFRAGARVSYNCAPVCERELNVGDELNAFKEIAEQIGARMGISQGAVQAPDEGE